MRRAGRGRAVEGGRPATPLDVATARGPGAATPTRIRRPTARLFAPAALDAAMEEDALPSGWEVWSDQATKVVWAFRPDVFDTAAFPAACMPTIYLSKGQRGRRPGPHDPPPDAPWYVTLFLEPEVSRDAERVDTRAGAEETALDLAEQFAAGEVDYRTFYQVPRESYLDRLDELTGRE